MKKMLVTSVLYTVVTAVVLGIAYPLAITAISQLTMRDKANGQILSRNGEAVGSALIGQPFTGSGFFHSRPSAAGTAGYDAGASSGSNLGPTSKALLDRENATLKTENTGTDIPVDLATASGSGLDPDISPAAALYQVPRVARERSMPEDAVRTIVMRNIQQRQFGLLGEARVNVLKLNMDLTGAPQPHVR
jgi:K+-transporting ATPase ATPase C chain